MDLGSTSRRQEAGTVWMAIHRPQRKHPLCVNSAFVGKTPTDNWLLEGSGGYPWNGVGMVAVGGSGEKRVTTGVPTADDGWSSRATTGSAPSRATSRA